MKEHSQMSRETLYHPRLNKKDIVFNHLIALTKSPLRLQGLASVILTSTNLPIRFSISPGKKTNLP